MTHPMTPTPTPGAHTMTDPKALIAEAREAKIILSVRLPDEEMMQIARLLDLNGRLAAALEEAPRIEAGDGWIKAWQGDKLVLTVSSSAP